VAAFHKQTLLKPDGRRLWLYAREPSSDSSAAPAPPGEAPAAPNPHLRWHPLRGEWVAYAPYRQTRTFLPDFNPLAPGADTEVPVGSWDVAVFENRFPTLYALAHDAPALEVQTQPARGSCEVVVFTQSATGSLGTLPLDRLDLVLSVWADRTTELSARNDVAYVFPFENRGVEVGVTLHHPHGQIYAYPFVPPVVARALSQLQPGQFSRMVANENERVIYGGPQAVAFVPVCARFPFEVWVAPRRAALTLADLDDAERLDLARALKTTLLKYDALWQRPNPYVLSVYQAPSDGNPYPQAHLRIELCPVYRMRDRLKYLAGSELGAGVFTADTLPEDTARTLQALEVSLE
jgi:UDPglucose--hexose-1-phosphate uridylyltransferase